MLEVSPQEAEVIRDALEDHKKELLADLWSLLESSDQKRVAQRLRAAAALALYDPTSSRWDKVSGSVVAQLVKEENPVYLGIWLTAFRPVKEKLGQPLAAVFADQREERRAERANATTLLDDYATERPDLLACLLTDADEKQFARFFPKVEAQRGRLVGVWNGLVTLPLASEKQEADKERLSKRQANAAVALLRVGVTEKVWPLLRESPDPRSRSYLIHRLVPYGADRPTFQVDPRSLILKRLDVEKEVSIRRALLLCLGELGLGGIGDRDALYRKVETLYRDDPDPGIHGSAEWLLRKWQQQDRIKALEQEWVKKNQAARDERAKQIISELAPGQPRWYINGQGQTMVVIPGPVEFQMGSPNTEVGRVGGPNDKTEQRHQERIDRSFAIASKEVTVGQFLRFRKERAYNKDYSPSDDHPINKMTWYEAAAYCNWLSGQEKIPEAEWCYEPNEQKQYGPGMKMAKDYLTRTGYRLPSESEWEYACRSGSLTSRYYGEGEDLLGQYAWYGKTTEDKMLPVGSLKPNDLGLFDMLGNAMEWVNDRAFFYKPGLDREDTNAQITNDLNRVLRGGSYLDQASTVRSALRSQLAPSNTFLIFGFRPARTFR